MLQNNTFNVLLNTKIVVLFDCMLHHVFYWCENTTSELTAVSNNCNVQI